MKKYVRIIRSRVFWGLSISCMIILLFVCILQTNLEVSERYLVREYNKRIAELSGENEFLKIASAQNASLDRIIALVESFDFEKTDKIHHIKVLDNQVVVR